jgi:hypothetical protein
MNFIYSFFLSVVGFLSVTAICTSQLQPTIAGTSSTAGTQFNNGMILLGITGNEIDTLPPVLTFSEECGDVLCRATELSDYGVDPSISAQVDQGIFDIFIRDSVNSNYKLELITSPKISPLPKITTFDFKLVVKDRTQDAKAVLVVIDRAGKFVEKTFSYKAIPLPDFSRFELDLRVFDADTIVTSIFYITNRTNDIMYIDSIYLKFGTVFKITHGEVLSRVTLAPGREHSFTIDYKSTKGTIGDTTPDTDFLRVRLASCRLDKYVPLVGRFAQSSIKISKGSLSLWTSYDGSNFGGGDHIDTDSISIVNSTNSKITIESIYLAKDSVFRIIEGNISTAMSLNPGDKHLVIIRYDPLRYSHNDYDYDTDYDTLHIKILGEANRLVCLDGRYGILDVDEGSSTSPKFSISTTPNPANQSVIVSINGNYSKSVFLRIYDAIGREMTACATELDNTTGVLIPNITALPIGTYRLVATTAAGTVLSTKLLLIQR